MLNNTTNPVPTLQLHQSLALLALIFTPRAIGIVGGRFLPQPCQLLLKTFENIAIQLPTTIWQSKKELTYYQLSLDVESGFLPPERLSVAWPNLKVKSSHLTPVITLDELMEHESVKPNWLVLNTLTSLHILLGAGHSLHDVDVLLVRAMVSEDLSFFENEKDVSDSDYYPLQPTILNDLQGHLSQHGFIQVASQREINPAFIHVIFVKDNQIKQQRIERLSRSLEKTEQDLLQLKDRNNELNQSLLHAVNASDLQKKKLINQQQAWTLSNTKLAEQLACQAQEKEALLENNQTLTEQLAEQAKEKEVLEESKQTLAEQLAHQAQEKEALLENNQTLTEQLAEQAKEKEVLEESKQALAKQLAHQAQEKEALLENSQTLTEQLAEQAKEKEVLEESKQALAEQLAHQAQEKEVLLENNQTLTEQLAEQAKEKEVLKVSNLVTTEQLVLIEKLEKEGQSKATTQEQEAEANLQQAAEVTSLKEQLTVCMEKTESHVKRIVQLGRTIKNLREYTDVDNFIEDITPFFYGKSLTYVDIGACYGDVFFKFHNAKGLKVREAHLFEPNPDNYKALTEKLKKLDISSIHTYKIGVYSKDTILQFLKAKTMTRVLDQLVDENLSSNVFEVNCSPLDSFIDVFTDHHINVLKIDVEGSEVEVLKGAQMLFKEQMVDLIYIELGFNVNATQQVYFGKVDSILQELGYRCFKIYEQKNEWIDDSPLLRRCNFAYMSASFAKSNPYKLVKELQKLREKHYDNANL
jgi:FkbM family methyltransferase